MSTPTSATLVTRSSRFLARLIDGILGGVPFLLIGDVFSSGIDPMMMAGRPDLMMQNPVMMGVFAGISSIAGLVFLAYVVVQAYLLTTRGQSIGKILLKIRIANQKTGVSTGFVQNVLLREVLNAVLGAIPFYGLVDALFIFRQDKRCIHDHIATTVVVKA